MASKTRGSSMVAARVALVTGAGAGIGRATALQFAAGGTAVAVVDVDAARAAAVAAEIEAAGGAAHDHAVDLADPSAATRLVGDVVARFGRLDFLVNNAAVTGAGSVLELAEGAWDHAMALNLKAPFL